MNNENIKTYFALIYLDQEVGSLHVSEEDRSLKVFAPIHISKLVEDLFLRMIRIGTKRLGDKVLDEHVQIPPPFLVPTLAVELRRFGFTLEMKEDLPFPKEFLEETRLVS